MHLRFVDTVFFFSRPLELDDLPPQETLPTVDTVGEPEKIHIVGQILVDTDPAARASETQGDASTSTFGQRGVVQCDLLRCGALVFMEIPFHIRDADK